MASQGRVNFSYLTVYCTCMDVMVCFNTTNKFWPHTIRSSDLITRDKGNMALVAWDQVCVWCIRVYMCVCMCGGHTYWIPSMVNSKLRSYPVLPIPDKLTRPLISNVAFTCWNETGLPSYSAKSKPGLHLERATCISIIVKAIEIVKVLFYCSIYRGCVWGEGGEDNKTLISWMVSTGILYRG